MNKKRWYDADPTVALAINLLEKADDNLKSEISFCIVRKAKDFGIRIESDINTNFCFVWQRKGDTSSDFYQAMEYMKRMEAVSQKELALEILRKLNN